MSTESYKIRLDTQLLKRLNEHLEKNNKKKNNQDKLTISKVINAALADYLDNAEVKVIDELYAPSLQRVMNDVTKRMENRMAALLAKSTADSARNLFIVLDLYAKYTGKSSADIYNLASAFAVKHIKDRDKELDMIQADMEKVNE